MLNWIREIVAFGIRRPGSEENLAVEQYLKERFREFGLSEVHLEEVAVNHWNLTDSQLLIKQDNRQFPCYSVPYTAWTPQEGIEAETLFIGDGSAEELQALELRGKIAVMNLRFGDLSASALKEVACFVNDPRQTIPDGSLHCANWLITNFPAYYEVQKRGAVGLIGILADSPIDGAAHYVPYDGHLKGLPAVWVGRESGAELTKVAQQGKPLMLKSIGTTREVDSHNVVATIPGKTKESIILTCHHDAPFASAVEDASGLSVLLSLAQYFSRRTEKLQRNLVFVASSGHFHGGIGNRVFVDKHRDGLLRNTVAALGIEHIAQEAEPDDRGGYRLTNESEVRILFMEDNPTLVSLLEAGVKKQGLERMMGVDPYLFGPEPPCDSAPFFTAGIPSVCHISGPLYLFDPQDTIDKVRAVDLPRIHRLFQELIESIDTIPAEELRLGCKHNLDDPPPPLPPWFQLPPL